MELRLTRFSTSSTSTLGLLHEIRDGVPEFLCFVLEDTFHAIKAPGSTRIPAGRYRIALRREGGFHARYGQRFGELHRGMLHLLDVPNFKCILVHCGNDADDTEGCLLVGDVIQQNVTMPGGLAGSERAYRRVYAPIAETLMEGEEVWIEIIYVDAGTSPAECHRLRCGVWQ